MWNLDLVFNFLKKIFILVSYGEYILPYKISAKKIYHKKKKNTGREQEEDEFEKAEAEREMGKERERKRRR